MRWFRRTKSATVDPKRYHAFQATSDPGVGAVAIAGDRDSGFMQGAIGATSAYQRVQSCAVPGCGQARNAPIHAPEE